ncbi:MAG: hypothetical protein IT577_15045 [Verrucomicrobiae bacterium]|nr:hypothetical protein [Verrucomicrobiae bacterium]
MLAMLRLCGWIVFTAGMAFVFLVLLDYGPARFSEGIRDESARVWAAVGRRVEAVKERAQRAAPQGEAARTQAR